MSIVEQKRIRPGYEPIEGYTLERRLGRGGYGEVWLAEAPGGLKKAVKFVYGQQDESRAAQELKSLERIKGVQHPFILSLERFELIENQLVIVTELADGSLEDIFNQHRKRGSCGIPRDVLLQYMRDAADALDYLHKLYKLQHLDIKPGNLLIVGGRVKVADFGLLKDLGDVDCSIVGGLTPIYAPPEVFDGRPSMYSDQYSLAVMYQELLTSTRPFSGRTIAQPATQHVQNAPNLNPLPAADRPIVARALEKNPERRFESCTEFVDRLIRPHTRTAASAPDVESESKRAVEIENLPQLGDGTALQCDTNQTHVLVVGLGGTGGSALNELRSRIYKLGAASPVSLHSVLIDTDREATQLARSIEPTETAARCHVIETPLRTAKEYRELGTPQLKTISRRWIYNVPRKGQTGGMRPLGRLALVERGGEVIEGLRAAIKEFQQAAHDPATAKVYLVGSLTGGTGSGIYFDVAHLMRHLLDETAMENTAIVSLLTTARFQGDPSRPLALHSTKSAIRELKHFLKPGNGYPGDPGAGWPSVPAARSPLHDAYLIAQPTSSGAPSALATAVNYLWCDACVCGDWLEKGRREANESAPTIGLRSVGAVEIGEATDWQSSMLAPYSTRSLLLRWLGDPRDCQTAAADWTARIKRRCDLNVTSLKLQVEQWFGASQQTRRERLMEQLKTLDPAVLQDDAAVRARMVRWLSGAIDLEQAEVAACQTLEQVEREVRLRLQDRRVDLSGVLDGIKRLIQHARSLRDELMKESEQSFRTLESKADAGPANQIGPSDNAVSRSPLSTLRHACDLGEQLVGVVAARVAAAIMMTLEQKLEEMSEAYTDASARIAQAIQQVSEGGSAIDPWTTVSDELRKQSSHVLEQLHQRHVTGGLFRILRQSGSVALAAMISEMNSTAATLVRELLAQLGDGDPVIHTSDDSKLVEGRRTVTLGGGTFSGSGSAGGASSTSVATGPLARDFCDSTSVADTQSWPAGRQDKQNIAMTVETAIDAVRPSLLECGGKQRLFLVCRDSQEKEQLLERLPQQHRASVTTILTRSAVPMLIHEAQGIEANAVLAWLDSLTGDDGQISSRLSTRCDIEWE